MREVLPYMLPGDKNDYIEKVPKILPAAVFVRENGVMAMSEYNGIVMLQVNGLSGHMEADEVKERVKELPQTYLAFIGSSGKSVKYGFVLRIPIIVCLIIANRRKSFMRMLIVWL